MEKVSFEIERQDIAEALQAEAAAHGRSVADEVAALVEQTYAVKAAKAKPVDEGNWVDELIKLGGGVGLRIPESRSFVRYAPDYPRGMEPLPGESFVDHISRISRPGIDLEIERDRTPHEGPDL